MWIVKLGGSLHDAPELGIWLGLLATAPGPARIVVPGGGPFADAVRELQPQLGFGEIEAHRMAILAMQQYGLFLHGLEPRLRLAETREELGAAGSAVWLPWRLAGRHPALRPSWDVTSDSIAAWLAAEIGAEALLLVKSAALPEGEATAAMLTCAGVLDPCFPAYAAALPCPVWLVGRDDPGVTTDLLAGRPAAACRVRI